ncbi:hypothetical protein J7J58_05635 [candidate division WOR-3 bacterium]|jgi:hypothetical protein|nr:hypothetical protein [candidate division WOR-3 bacterium]
MKKRIIALILLVISVVILLIGAKYGQIAESANKGNLICLDCIGIA